MAGGMAVKCAATEDLTDKMVAFERNAKSVPYVNMYKAIPLTDVANTEHKFPLEWINEKQNGITRDFRPYVLPLIEGQSKITWEHGVPRFARLNKVRVK